MCEDLWEDCDDSLFSEICDTEAIEKVNVDEDIQTNEVKHSLLPDNAESTPKRKYCATESNETIEERKKIMIKKLKSNSLFKL